MYYGKRVGVRKLVLEKLSYIIYGTDYVGVIGRKWKGSIT
jgi:hypothetical protein